MSTPTEDTITRALMNGVLKFENTHYTLKDISPEKIQQITKIAKNYGDIRFASLLLTVMIWLADRYTNNKLYSDTIILPDDTMQYIDNTSFGIRNFFILWYMICQINLVITLVVVPLAIIYAVFKILTNDFNEERIAAQLKTYEPCFTKISSLLRTICIPIGTLAGLCTAYQCGLKNYITMYIVYLISIEMIPIVYVLTLIKKKDGCGIRNTKINHAAERDAASSVVQTQVPESVLTQVQPPTQVPESVLTQVPESVVQTQVPESVPTPAQESVPTPAQESVPTPAQESVPTSSETLEDPIMDGLTNKVWKLGNTQYIFKKDTPKKIQQIVENFRKIESANFFLTIAILLANNYADSDPDTTISPDGTMSQYIDNTSFGVRNWLILWCILYRPSLITVPIAIMHAIAYTSFKILTGEPVSFTEQLETYKQYYADILSCGSMIFTPIAILIGLCTAYQCGSDMHRITLYIIYFISTKFYPIVHALTLMKKKETVATE